MAATSGRRSATGGRLGAVLRVWLEEVLRLVLPLACAGCGRDDDPWCADCRRPLDASPWRCEDRAGRLDHLDGRPPLPVWTLADYVGPVRTAIVSWKDGGRLDLTPTFEAMARTAGTRLAASTHLVPRSTGPPAGSTGRAGPLVVVPVPSTAAARGRRGVDLVAGLARAVADGIGSATSGAPVPGRAVLDGPGSEGAVVVPALARRRGRDQVGLGARARGRNLAGRVRVTRRMRGVVPGCAMLLVDDVLTTGATLTACERALTAAGGDVLGALTLASTPGPTGAVPVRLGPGTCGRVESAPGATPGTCGAGAALGAGLAW